MEIMEIMEIATYFIFTISIISSESSLNINDKTLLFSDRLYALNTILSIYGCLLSTAESRQHILKGMLN